MITSGTGIRGAASTIQKIKTSFKHFYETYSKILQCNLDIVKNNGVETAIMKPLAQFFKTAPEDKIMDLGEVTYFEIEVDNNNIYNSIKVGYDDNSYENSDGKGEFNTEMQFSMNINSLIKELDLKVPYRADSYGMEYVLIDFEEEETVDGESDNDTFLIVKDSALDIVDRQITISGSYADDTMFNAGISPKQILMSNRIYISSFLDLCSHLLKFASSKKDLDIIIGGINERLDYTAPALQYYRPIFFIFETGLKKFNINKLADNINGYVAFTFKGKAYKGFLRSFGMKVEKKQEWKLVALPDMVF
jgi:hypothetical protein